MSGADAVTVTFRCGHVAVLGRTADLSSVSCDCGETRVSRVSAPAPRFIATDCQVAGPLVTHG